MILIIYSKCTPETLPGEFLLVGPVGVESAPSVGRRQTELLLIYFREGACIEVVGNPKADFAESIEFLLQLYFIGFRSTKKNTNDAGNLQVVPPSDASSVPLVKQNEVSVVFDRIADCCRLPESSS